MYRLEFKENRSKYFGDALAFAVELGGTFSNGIVVLEIPEEKLLEAYRTMRTLFGFIQNWKGTVAYFNNLEVHPYQFVLHAHMISECADIRNHDQNNCHINSDTLGWGCKRIDFISYNLTGSGNYKDNRRFWYNHGRFDADGKWRIDKETIKEKLIGYGRDRALYLCPFYDEMNIIMAVDQLPDYIVPDNITFKIHFSETWSNGIKLQVPSNIRHVTERNYSNYMVLGRVKA